MDAISSSFDWNQARAFLATAEAGTFSAAARRLGLAQPTLGRQVAALEAALGVTLFERTARGPKLTEAGFEVLEAVRAMQAAADRAMLSATGQSQSIEGHVAISAADLMARFHLFPALEELRRTAPGLTVEIVAANALSDLGRREADIAIRHVRPDQPDLIARLLRETVAAFYAAPGFLARHGHPRTVAELGRLDFVGFDEPKRMVMHLDRIGVPVSPENFPVWSTDGSVAWEAVRRGFGVGVMVCDTAEASGGVERIMPDLPPVRVPVWLVTHRELRTSRRIRLVFDTLARHLSGAGSRTCL